MAGGIYTGRNATVIMNPAPLLYAQVFRTGSTPDGYLKRSANKVAVVARRRAPVRSGALRSSIKVAQNRNSTGNRYSFGYRVSANTDYAYYVHEGTGPSPRWPVNRKVMKFTGREGVAVYRDFVMHPGTPAVPFLQEALVAMVI